MMVPLVEIVIEPMNTTQSRRACARARASRIADSIAFPAGVLKPRQQLSFSERAIEVPRLKRE